MGWVDDLDVAARSSGLVVVELPGWRDRDHGQFATERPTALVLHHTGSSGSGAEKVVRDGRPGLEGPLAQLTLRRDGTVGIVAHGVAWHAGTGSWPSIGRNNANSRALGIEAIYNGGDLTDAQRAAYPKLAAAIARHYEMAPGNVIGHREWTDRKVDPGQIDMPTLRGQVAALLAGAPARPATGVRGDPLVYAAQDRLRRAYKSYGGALVLDGINGPKTTAALKEFQRRSGLRQTGVVDPATRAALRI